MTTTPAPALSQDLDLSGTSRVPFGRLVKVEVRKMVDTRAGFWLLLSTGILLLAITILVMVVALLSDDVTIGANGWSQVMGFVLSLMLPVFAITVVTSEWGQRTNLVTFTHEPHRARVIGAKLTAVVLMALAALALALVLGAVANLIYAALDGSSPNWNLEPSTLAWTIVIQLLYFFMAFGFGSLLLNAPGAIAIYYAIALIVPFMVSGPIFGLASWGPDVVPWYDLNFATQALVDGTDLKGKEIAQILVTSFAWVVVPFTLGLNRILRAEVK